MVEVVHGQLVGALWSVRWWAIKKEAKLWLHIIKAQTTRSVQYR